MTASIAQLVRTGLAGVVALALLVSPVHADSGDDTEVVARKVLIVLRTVAYDRALATRAPGDVVVALIVHAPTDASSAERDRWLRGFAALPNVKAGGRRVQARAIELTKPELLDAALGKLRPAVVIVMPGLGHQIAAIKQATRKHDVLSVSTSERDVQAGLAVTIAETDTGTEILVNLDASRAEGVKFSAGLLQLARLIDEVRR